MERVKEIIIRNLLESDDFTYIYDEKDVHHGDEEKINSFFGRIRKECKQKETLDKSGAYKLVEFYFIVNTILKSNYYNIFIYLNF